MWRGKNGKLTSRFGVGSRPDRQIVGALGSHDCSPQRQKVNLRRGVPTIEEG